jgi:hypothetical protein
LPVVGDVSTTAEPTGPRRARIRTGASGTNRTVPSAAGNRRSMLAGRRPDSVTDPDRAPGDAGTPAPDARTGPAGSWRFGRPDASVERGGRPVVVGRRLALGGVAAGLVLISVLAVGVLGDVGGGDVASDPPPHGATAGAVARPRSGHSRCPTVVGPRADVDRDGCAELVVADGRRVRVGNRSFLVGEAGDRVAIGDWNCDGTATPAVLRLATGAIYTFAGWPDRGALPPATLVASVEGATDIERRTGPSPGCPVLVIDRRDQPARVLDLGAGR